MSDATQDPHVLVSVRIGLSEKLINLPSHRARWGWILMLGQAKLCRPPGVFTSLAQARIAAGAFQDCVAAWLDAKLLHAAAVAAECKSCARQYPNLDPKAIVVHDFLDHQDRKSRSQEWRESVGLTSGHNSLRETRGNNGETTGKPSRVRAPAGPLHSPSLSPSQETEGVQGEPDAWDAFAIRTGEVPGEKIRGWLNELAEAHGEARVVAMLEQLPKTQRNSVDYLKAVRDALRAADFEAEKAERAAEKARTTAKRAPVRPLPVAQDISPEEAKRLAAEYIAQSKGDAA